MKFAPQQDRALKAVAAWLRDPDAPQVFKLFGFAGTGKTTLAKHLAEGVDGRVVFCAYTGKAALVLRQKGCPNPTTIHKLIYLPKDKSQRAVKEIEAELARIRDKGKGSWFIPGSRDLYNTEEEARAAAPGGADPVQLGPQHVEKLKDRLSEERKNLNKPMFSVNPESEAKDAALIVVDECSMVGQRVAEDLLSYGVKVLVLGDPAQLPPVGDEGYFTKDKPDFLLTDIHRQAEGSPIIHLATMIRNQQRPDFGSYGESRVIPVRDLTRELAETASQILVGRNATRHAYNARMRALAGYDGSLDPVKGDKLVCLQNNHEIGVLNGAIYFCDRVELEHPAAPHLKMWVTEDGGDGRPTELMAHRAIFQQEEVPYWERKEAEHFDYGYAITVHKSQGSQWRNPLIINESGAFRADWWRWLYTAVTRASDTVTIVNL